MKNTSKTAHYRSRQAARTWRTCCWNTMSSMRGSALMSALGSMAGGEGCPSWGSRGTEHGRLYDFFGLISCVGRCVLSINSPCRLVGGRGSVIHDVTVTLQLQPQSRPGMVYCITMQGSTTPCYTHQHILSLLVYFGIYRLAKVTKCVVSLRSLLSQVPAAAK